jgi:hypothetical protein
MQNVKVLAHIPGTVGPVLLNNLRRRHQIDSTYYSLFYIDLKVVLMFLMRLYRDIFMLTFWQNFASD